MENISNYNVIYHSPGKSDRSAMPLGNGETTVSAWITEEGKLRFYISRTDALTELERTVKLGMAEIDLGASFCQENDFTQELDLSRGQIIITSGQKQIKLWVDKESDIIYVKGQLNPEQEIRASYYTWRQEPRVPASSPVLSTGLPEAADVVKVQEGNIVFFHKNGENGLKNLARLQCVDDVHVIRDAVSGRIFGGIMHMEHSTNEGMFLKKARCREFLIKIAVHSEQTDNEGTWFEEVLKKLHDAKTEEASQSSTEAFWKQYWRDSYIYIKGDEKRQPSYSNHIREMASEPMECSDTESHVTRAYVLTKFMIACCKDGEFPLYYNGWLFNLCPGSGMISDINTFSKVFTTAPESEYPTGDVNPDERSWCQEHLWQNLRHPYYTMLAQGEFESLRKMFAYYKHFWELNRIRAQRFYGAKGQHNTEMTLICGLQSEQIYGTDRSGKPDGWSQNRWGGSIEISPGLELLKLMLDYYRYTLEEEFVQSDILPFAKDLFLYIETRFQTRKNGKIVITPLNSLETYFDTTDPAPVVAGMHSVLNDILKLAGLGEDRTFFENAAELLPDIPEGEKNGKRVLLPAADYKEERKNVEAPELYAICPFGLLGKFIGDEELADNTFENAIKTGGQMRPFILGDCPDTASYSGWQHIGNVAAMLGMRDTCREILENNCAMQNPGNRFPAMWGPTYDAVPDSDHGANIVQLLQIMVMQCKEEKIYLLPAIPDTWDVSMRLYAPYKTVVECEYKKGKLSSFKTFPKTRERDVIVTIQ